MNRQTLGIIVGVVVLVAISLAGALVAADAPKTAASKPATGPTDQMATAKAATEILNTKCVGCHNHGFNNGPDKPRSPWGQDVPRLIKGGQIKPGNPETSRFYNIMLVKGGHPGKGSDMTPTPAEIAIVHDWIAAGAADPKAGRTTKPATSAPATSPAK